MFDQYGWYCGPAIPADCVADCSHSGDCSVDVEWWRDMLEFKVPRELAIKWLRESGAYADEELEEKSDVALAEIVLWMACCEIKEEGEWLGLVS